MKKSFLDLLLKPWGRVASFRRWMRDAFFEECKECFLFDNEAVRGEGSIRRRRWTRGMLWVRATPQGAS